MQAATVLTNIVCANALCHSLVVDVEAASELVL